MTTVTKLLIFSSMQLLLINGQDLDSDIAAEVTFEPTMDPVRHEEEENISAVHDASDENDLAVYSLLLITVVVIFVIVSLLFYKRCLDDSPSSNGYMTPQINELEEGNESEQVGEELTPDDGLQLYDM